MNPKKTNDPSDPPELVAGEHRITLNKRTDRTGKSFFVGHLDIGMTLLIFTECKHPVAVLKPSPKNTK